MFRECLKQNIFPFIIQNENREVYISALNKAQTNKDNTDLVELFQDEQKKYMDQCIYFDVEERYKRYLENKCVKMEL